MYLSFMSFNVNKRWALALNAEREGIVGFHVLGQAVEERSYDALLTEV